MNERHSRTALLLGEQNLQHLTDTHVLIVGAGGVGGWCAEALARSGIGHITLVDDDVVVPSNLNRQCAATMATLGQVKVDALRERLLAVNPDCQIDAIHTRYPNATIDLSDYHMIVDAIDSITSKAELILSAQAAHVPIISSMGAARRLDPTRVHVTNFDKVTGDGLARALRQKFKRLGRNPKRFSVVWSDEVPLAGGSAMPVVATFGACLAAEVINESCRTKCAEKVPS